MSVFKKNAKLMGQSKMRGLKNDKQNRENCECGDAHNSENRSYTYCAYCGAKVSIGEKRCSSCKAKIDD